MPNASIPQAGCVMVELPCTRGDPAVYEKLYRECYATAYSRAYYLLGQHEDAEDAVQASFMAVWKHWPHLEATGLCSYLLQSVSYRCIELLRRKRHPTISLEANQIDAAVSWDIDTRLDLAAARARLSPGQQELVKLYAEGCTWREIAGQLKLTRAQIFKRLYQARVQLRKQVAA